MAWVVTDREPALESLRLSSRQSPSAQGSACPQRPHAATLACSCPTEIRSGNNDQKHGVLTSRSNHYSMLGRYEVPTREEDEDNLRGVDVLCAPTLLQVIHAVHSGFQSTNEMSADSIRGF